MLNKLIVITAIVLLGISCAIGDNDGNNGKGNGNKGNNDVKMVSGGDYLNPNSISNGGFGGFNFPWFSSDFSFYSQGDITKPHFRSTMSIIQPLAYLWWAA